MELMTPEEIEEEIFDEVAQNKYLLDKHTGSRSHDIGDRFEAFLIMVALVKLGAFIRLGRKNPSLYRIIQHAEEWIDDVNVITPTRRRFLHVKSGQTKGTWSKNLKRDFRYQPHREIDGKLETRELVAPTTRMVDLLTKNRPADLQSVRVRLLDIDCMSSESWQWWFLDKSLARLDVLNHQSEMIYERMWAHIFSARFVGPSTNETLAQTFANASRYSDGAITSLQPPNRTLQQFIDRVSHIKGLNLAVNGETLIYRFEKSFEETWQTMHRDLTHLSDLSAETPATIPGFLVWIGAFE